MVPPTGCPHLKLEQYLVDCPHEDEDVAGDVEEVPDGEEGAPLPPSQGQVQLIVVELAHSLAQPVGSEESLGCEEDRHKAQTENNEVQGDQGHQNGIVFSCRRGEGGVRLLCGSWGGLGRSYSCLPAQFRHSGAS